MGRPLTAARLDSRARLLTAARAEFALKGYAGASVDRIARRARLNKAMIYYHFRSKDGLYREIIRDMFGVLGSRVAALPHGSDSPVDKLQAFVAALADEAISRPDFPGVMLREMTEQGRHLDTPTMELLLAVPETFMAIVAQGVAAGLFRPVHPMVAYFAVLGPIALWLASARLRERVTRLTGRSLPDLARERLIADVQTAALAILAAPTPRPNPATRSRS